MEVEKNGGLTSATTLSLEGMLTVAGEYGRYQKVVTLMFCIMTLPCIFPVMILYFTADNPTWVCSHNNSSSISCPYENITLSSDDQQRCHMQREDWHYTLPKHYSIVTEYDIHCDNEYLISLATSMLFIGWIFGAGILGWFADNYGRKRVIFVSISIVMLFGIISAFMPNIYLFIVCRFIIGFFLPGTFPYMFVLITEIVGTRYRAFSSLTIYVAAAVSLSLLCLKAYFVRDWRTLYLICNAPYLFVLLFYKFVPESVWYLRVKGKNDTLQKTFEKISYWNGNSIPDGIEVERDIEANSTKHKSNPLDLFNSTSVASRTLIQGFAYFVVQMSYYGVYIAAGDITGHKYRDYLIITVIEVPLTFLVIYFTDRFGGKKTTMGAVLLGAIACTGLGFTPENSSYKVLRIIFALVGKCSVSSGSNTIQTWTVELYSTHVRGEAVGFMQILTRAGAGTAPWIDEKFAEIYHGASFLLMGGSLFIAFGLLYFLPEMLQGDVIVIEGDEETGGGGTQRNICDGESVHGFENKLFENDSSTVNLTALELNMVE